MLLKAFYTNYGKDGQGRHSSQQMMGGNWVQTITQQHLLASTWGVVTAVKPPTNIAKKAISRIIALNFFIEFHLLVAFTVEVVAVSQAIAVMRYGCECENIQSAVFCVKYIHIMG